MFNLTDKLQIYHFIPNQIFSKVPLSQSTLSFPKKAELIFFRFTPVLYLIIFLYFTVFLTHSPTKVL